MKKLPILLAVVVALGGVGPAIAASSVDLSVKGSITPSACSPTLSKGGVVEHGKISVSDLNPQPHLNTLLPTATLELTVSCAAATLVAIKSRDNRAGSSAEPDNFTKNFGLGFVDGDKKVGWYILKMGNALADGGVRSLIESADGNTWLNADPADQVWQPGWWRSVAAASGGAELPVPVQNMTVDIRVETTILALMQLPVGQEIPIDGSATLDIVYL